MNNNEKTNYLDFVESKFFECFSEKGYLEEKSVNITSQIDPTVDFIGSKISPLKKYILNNNLEDCGRFMIQNSMKLKALKHIKDSLPQTFGSYYKCMGILSKPKLEQCVYDTFDYLINPKYLAIPLEDIRIRICSKDEDLLNAIKNVDNRIKRELDTVELKHYRHRYGLDKEGITGRDFNIAIKKRNTDDFFNCGTFVIMETSEKPIAIDMGIGNCSLSMCKFGTSSTIDSSRMADIIQIKTVEDMKFADSLIATSILLKENIIDHPSKHFRKKFRQYYNALMYWNEKYKVPEDVLIQYIIKYLNAEYNSDFSNKKEEWVKILKIK